MGLPKFKLWEKVEVNYTRSKKHPKYLKGMIERFDGSDEYPYLVVFSENHPRGLQFDYFKSVHIRTAPNISQILSGLDKVLQKLEN